MRGLDIRVMLAQARITAFLDREAADGMYYHLMDEAFTQGTRDAWNGIDQIPMLFKDEELLISCWRSGFESEMERIAVGDGPGGHDGTSHPCVMHG